MPTLVACLWRRVEAIQLGRVPTHFGPATRLRRPESQWNQGALATSQVEMCPRTANSGLVAELADIGRLRTAVTDGTGKVGRLARRAGCWLRDEHGLELEVMRPFTKRRGPDPACCLRLVTEHLARPGTAAIVATEDHWTVARAVSGRRLLLFDSHDRRHFRLGTAFGAGSGANRLCLHGTYLLRVPWSL